MDYGDIIGDYIGDSTGAALGILSPIPYQEPDSQGLGFRIRVSRGLRFRGLELGLAVV